MSYAGPATGAQWGGYGTQVPQYPPYGGPPYGMGPFAGLDSYLSQDTSASSQQSLWPEGLFADPENPRANMSTTLEELESWDGSLTIDPALKDQVEPDRMNDAVQNVNGGLEKLYEYEPNVEPAPRVLVRPADPRYRPAGPSA